MFLGGLWQDPSLRPSYTVFTGKRSLVLLWTSFGFGVGMMVIQLLVSMKLLSFGGILGIIFKNSLYSGVFAMLGGLVLVPIVSLLTKKSIPEGTEEQFSCYEKEITVAAKRALGEK